MMKLFVKVGSFSLVHENFRLTLKARLTEELRVDWFFLCNTHCGRLTLNYYAVATRR
jgi:hypothetical protein